MVIRALPYRSVLAPYVSAALSVGTKTLRSIINANALFSTFISPPPTKQRHWNSVIEPTSGKKLHQNSVRLRLPPPACQVFWQSRLIYSTEYCTATVYCIRRQAAGVLACTRGRLYAESEVGIMPETVHARCRLPHKAYFGGSA
jgi:hypothetical protein